MYVYDINIADAYFNADINSQRACNIIIVVSSRSTSEHNSAIVCKVLHFNVEVTTSQYNY